MNIINHFWRGLTNFVIAVRRTWLSERSVYKLIKSFFIQTLWILNTCEKSIFVNNKKAAKY